MLQLCLFVVDALLSFSYLNEAMNHLLNCLKKVKRSAPGPCHFAVLQSVSFLVLFSLCLCTEARSGIFLLLFSAVHLLQERERSHAFRAVGLMAFAVHDDINPHLESILLVVRSALPATKDVIQR